MLLGRIIPFNEYPTLSFPNPKSHGLSWLINQLEIRLG